MLIDRLKFGTGWDIRNKKGVDLFYGNAQIKKNARILVNGKEIRRVETTKGQKYKDEKKTR